MCTIHRQLKQSPWSFRCGGIRLFRAQVQQCPGPVECQEGFLGAGTALQASGSDRCFEGIGRVSSELHTWLWQYSIQKVRRLWDLFGDVYRTCSVPPKKTAQASNVAPPAALKSSPIKTASRVFRSARTEFFREPECSSFQEPESTGTVQQKEPECTGGMC